MRVTEAMELRPNVALKPTLRAYRQNGRNSNSGILVDLDMIYLVCLILSCIE